MAKKHIKLELTWIGKGDDPELEPRILIEDPTRRISVLPSRGQNTDSAGTVIPTDDNLLIHGDNLLALKALEQEYTGKIKCIYIDPPYNTGSAFEYYDDGVEHSIWLKLMTHRLTILRRLLSIDGVIFVQIDDKEMAYLKVIMDEVFERRNFLNTIVVKTSDPSGHKTVNPSPYSQTEYILMYAKERTKYKYEIRYVPSEYDPMYSRIIVNAEDHYSTWKVAGVADYFSQALGYEGVKAAKKHFGSKDFDAMVAEFAEQNAYRVFQPTAISNDAGRAIVELRDLSKEQSSKVFYYPRHHQEDIFILGGRQIYFLSSKIKVVDGVKTIAKPLTNFWGDIPYNGIANEGNVSFKNGKKPEKLLRRCIEITTNPGDWVLDSFLGSGTTAAVAQKMGRKWIGIELGQHAHTHCYPRLKAVCEGTDLGGISKAVGWSGGGGFRFYSLAPSLLREDKWGNLVINETYNADQLAAAMAKQEGFRYQPHESLYWKQAQSSEQDFLFTTTQFMTVEHLDRIHEEMQPGESLLICCKSFQEACTGRYATISLRKIPVMLLGRCEFNHDDYSFIINSPLDSATDTTNQIAERAVLDKELLQTLQPKAGRATADRSKPKKADDQLNLF